MGTCPPFRSHNTSGTKNKGLLCFLAMWRQPLKAPHILARGMMTHGMLASGMLHGILFYRATRTSHKDLTPFWVSSRELDFRMALYRCLLPSSLPCPDRVMNAAWILEKMGTTHYFKGSILANIFPIIADYWMVSWSQKGVLIDVIWIRRFLVVLMASISDSSAPVDPPPLFEDGLQDIHRKLRY